MKRIVKKLIVVALAGTMVLGLSGCGKSTKSTLNKSEIVIGFDNTFVPMGFKDEKGEDTGFDVELAKEVFKRLGKQVKFQNIDWSMKETELSSKNIDLIWNGYSITDERKEKVQFSDPYLDNSQIIVTLANSAVSTKADLKGKKVGTQSQSSSLEALNKEEDVVKGLKDGKPVLFDTFNDAFMDLEAGRTDAIVADEILARYYIAQRGESKYKVLSDNFGNEQYAVGARKDDKDLIDSINKTLKEMKSDKTSGKISEKWFGKDIVK